VPVATDLPASAPSLDVRGLWLGTADGRSLKITIDQQGGDAFAGVAELQLEDGTWAALPLKGTVDEGSKAITFSQVGGEGAFSGSVSGMRASGTFVMNTGHVPKKWSVVR